MILSLFGGGGSSDETPASTQVTTDQTPALPQATADQTPAPPPATSIPENLRGQWETILTYVPPFYSGPYGDVPPGDGSLGITFYFWPDGRYQHIWTLASAYFGGNCFRTGQWEEFGTVSSVGSEFTFSPGKASYLQTDTCGQSKILDPAPVTAASHTLTLDQDNSGWPLLRMSFPTGNLYWRNAGAVSETGAAGMIARMNASTGIKFDDGAAYESFMGVWSRFAGVRFLDWLAPPPGGRWVEVGCGNGAFTELLLALGAAAEVEGIDPSEAQIAYALARLADRPARFRVGDAAVLPYADAAFDAAVMALVIFFVPDPAEGVAEMARVVRRGGSVSAYAWDMLGGGFPYAAMTQEIAALGFSTSVPPSVEASRIDALRTLWQGAGLVDVATCTISIERTFDDFDAFWRIARTGPRFAPVLATMGPQDLLRLQERLRARLPAADDGRITYGARANAVRGRVPG